MVALKRNAVQSRDEMEDLVEQSILPAINNKDNCPFLLKIHDW